MSKINNPELKAAWLKALRSGEYKQTEGKLMYLHTRSNGEEVRSFCCLGVLCDVAIKESVLKAAWGADIIGDPSKDPQTIYLAGDAIGEDDLLPSKFAESIGISRNPYLIVNKRSYEAAVLNDDGTPCECGEENEECEECEKCEDGMIRYNFSMIADLIEEQL